MRSGALSRLLALLAVLTLVAAACGDDGGDGGLVEQGGDDDTAQQDDGGDDGDAGEGGGDFAALVEGSEDARFRATYESTSGGETSQAFTISQDPPRRAMIFEGGRLIDDGEQVVMCDGSGGQGQCFVMPSTGGAAGTDVLGAAFAAPFLAYNTLLEEGVPGVETTEGETEIAGRAATCATIDASGLASLGGAEAEAASSVEVCVDAETGILLRWGTPGTGDVFEAVEVGEPQESDFEVPSEPQELPGVGGQGGFEGGGQGGFEGGGEGGFDY